jgi:hypothetical protein
MGSSSKNKNPDKTIAIINKNQSLKIIDDIKKASQGKLGPPFNTRI